MKRLKEYISLPCSLGEALEGLEFNSTSSRGYMYGMAIMVSAEELEHYYRDLETIKVYLGRTTLNKVELLLHSIRDIRGSIESLRIGATLNDIELFEVKSLLLTSQLIREELEQSPISSLIELCDLSEPLSLLDPEGSRVSSFYIYDIYSDELPKLRREFQSNQSAELAAKISDIESSIREDLCHRIRPYWSAILESLINLLELDIKIAKSKFQRTLGLTTPKFNTDGVTKLTGLFNPVVRYEVAQRGGEFQPIDIEFALDTTTIIGANMGGKTVTLKSVALCQILSQFGFGSPALSAEIDIKGDIVLAIGDSQSTKSGYSSFASEILAIDAIIKSADSGLKIIALIDEPARTTNPAEGTAIVEATIERLRGANISLLLTTHYKLSHSDNRRYRVKGLSGSKMDYSLIATTLCDIPQEAISVAESLGVDREWLELAKRHIE